VKATKTPHPRKLKKRKIHFFRFSTTGAGSILEVAEDNLISRAVEKALAGQEAA
jgi:ribosomal protein L10